MKRIFFLLALLSLVFRSDLLAITIQIHETQDLSYQFFSYDEVLDLLEKLEEGELEQRCSFDEFERINQFIAYLAKQGVLPNEIDEGLALESDIREFLNFEQNPYEYAYSLYQGSEYAIIPALFYGQRDILLCKGWLKKKWEQTKKFVKKHKKAIIVGAAVVVAAATVVGIVAAVSTAGAAAAGASIAEAGREEGDEWQSEALSIATATSLQEEITSFKERIADDLFLQTDNLNFPLEENGRILGRVVAHKMLDNVTHQVSHNFLPDIDGRRMIERVFSPEEPTNYVPARTLKRDFRESIYQLRGEHALALQQYDQAISDFGRVIELNPNNHEAYLERATAHLQLGDHAHSLEDYQHYTAKTPATLWPMTDFTLGFAKGLPLGIKESVTDLGLFAYDCIINPINTAEEIGQALFLLGKLAASQEWSVIGQALVPEVCELITKWDTLSPRQQGELSGHAFGKHGTNIFLPGAAPKFVAMAGLGSREIAATCRAFQTAKKTLALEVLSQTNTFPAIISTADKLVEAGKAMDRGGLTKAGRALMKHGYREGSVFPKPVGTTLQINEHGQKILQEIVSDRQAVSYSNKFGGQDIFSSSGRGVRFDDKGNLMGFLQPRRNQ